MNAIRRIVRALRISSRAVERELGLSGAQLFVLQKLKQSSALSVKELAERTLTHQSSVSVVVSRLVERGLADRRLSPADGRQVELTLTPEGRALLGKAPRTAQERLVEAISGLPAAQRALLGQLLSEVVSRAGLSSEPPALFFESEGEKS
jgi:DNA-binding MarR family transcriptional regulator